MRRFFLLPLAVLVLLPACDLAAPTEPAVVEKETTEVVRARPAWAGTVAAGFLTIGLKDAAARLLPSIEDQEVAEALALHLRQLSAQLAAANAPAANQQLTAVLAILDSDSVAANANPAELTAIRLVLARAEAMLSE